MCGISGIFLPGGGATPDRNLLVRMNDALVHRGPDEGSIHAEPGIGLAHRRLSIIDIANGQQPLFNEDQSICVIFNGEIYNYRSLVEQLEERGHRFHTRSDTETIVHAWEEWGSDCVNHFRGMFAFAVWDRNQRTLFLARDRMGIKPLYYAQLPGQGVIFGSELKALLAHPELPRRYDPQAIEDYFAYGYVPEPRTILRGVHKLEPGHSLLLQDRAGALPEPRRYWDIPFVRGAHGSMAEAGEELISRLRDAVEIRLVSEVPLGAFLSGGVDSSAVVALMAGLNTQAVKTCSIGFDHPDYDESVYAAMVAQRYSTDHRTDILQPDDYGLVDRLAGLYDEPFADSSAMPTYRVCEATRRRVTVALSGDGGDENLAGYRRYYMHMAEEAVRNRLPESLRRRLFGPLGRFYPKADWAPRMLRAKSTFESLAMDSVEAWHHSVSRMTAEQRAALFSERLYADIGGYRALDTMRRHAAAAPTDDPLSLVQYLDMKTFLVGVLHKVDRASMAHSLEVRVPLLDHELVEWMSGLPPEWKLRGTNGKYLFKKALEPYLPHDVMYRPKKGFSIPLADWFRGPLRDKLREEVLSEAMLDSGLFRRARIESLLEQHQSGLNNHSVALWELLMFALSHGKLDASSA